jgi:hypothetical protein
LPTLERHHELAGESIHLKTAVLRDAVVASRRNTLNRSADRRTGREWQAAETALVEGISRLDTTARQFDELMTAATAVAERVLEKASIRLSEAWANDPARNPRVGSEVIRILNEEGGEMAAERVRVVRDIQASLVQALKLAADQVGMEPPEGELVQISDVPLIDCDVRRINVPLKRSWRQMFGKKSIVRDLRSQLDSSIRSEVEPVVYRYGKTLNAWCRKSLHELQRAFTTRADLYRATVSHDASRANGTPDDIAADLAELESNGDVTVAHMATADLSGSYSES